MDFAEKLRRQVKDAIDGAGGGANVAAAVNVDGKGRRTAVYSDESVTVVQRDGETQVIRKDKTGGTDGGPQR
jgi:hypothetical protein